jgi:hypothetical protein
VKESSASEKCKAQNVTGVDISFRRPEFAAIFDAKGSATVNDNAIEYSKIILNSTLNTDERWAVKVMLLGQITVCKLQTENTDCV